MISRQVISVVDSSPVASTHGCMSSSDSRVTSPTRSAGPSSMSAIGAQAGSTVEVSGVSGQNHVSTRSQHGISNPKLYTDGMIRYSLLASIGEPITLQEALEIQIGIRP
jgi:hypothetical protein